jgi:serine protease Do
MTGKNDLAAKQRSHKNSTKWGFAGASRILAACKAIRSRARGLQDFSGFGNGQLGAVGLPAATGLVLCTPLIGGRRGRQKRHHNPAEVERMQTVASRRFSQAWGWCLAAAVVLAWWLGEGVVQAQSSDPAIEHAKVLSRAFRRAAEATLPAVVKIQTFEKATRIEGRSLRSNPFRGTPFEDMFNDDFGRLFEEQPRDGLGSGVIIDPAGVILTNNHVVEGADEVYVTLHDGREFKAHDIKTDEQSDLAVLRIQGAGKLNAARLGDSDRLEIGDWVIAVGHPFKLEATVSAGIISGKGRSLRSINRAQFLQTDAAINPGNSGGPLVNLEGEVVGVNTAIASNSGGYQGIGFAVPINLAKWVSSQLLERGSVQRAYLGVAIEELTPDLADQFGVRHGQGVLVTEVYPDTPAGKAGFREGDVVLNFAGRDVHTPRQLQETVERLPLGPKHQVQVLRDGRTINLQVVLEPLPDRLRAIRPALEPGGGDTDPARLSNAELGIEVTNLSAEVARRLGFEGYTGVLVTQVEPGSMAYRKGLRSGMLILSIDRKRVANVEEFQQALKGASLKKGILLQVRSSTGGNHFIVLEEAR